MSTDSPDAGAGAKRYCPAHVPQDKVRSFDAYNDPRMKKDPLGALLDVSRPEPIYWNDIDAGFKKGCWVITRADDMRKVFTSADFQNNNYVNLQALVGERWPLIPTGIDGDVHRKYRAIMSPWFSAPSLAKFNDAIDQRADELIDRFADEGGCEFMDAFGRPFPISIFLELLGLPVSRMGEFLQWEYEMLSQSDFRRAAVATEQVLGVLQQLIQDRQATPRADLATTVVQAEIDGRPLNNDEMMGMLFGFFLGGLDTVATSLGLHFKELAANTALQSQLREHPEKIPAAVDELLRRYSPVSPRRQAMVDVEMHGVTIKAGDWVMLPTALGSLDPEEFENPMEVDIDRKNRRHFAFITGAHFCLGHILARRELEVSYRQWLSRIPPFRLGEKNEIEAHGGMTFGYAKLPLVWN